MDKPDLQQPPQQILMLGLSDTVVEAVLQEVDKLKAKHALPSTGSRQVWRTSPRGGEGLCLQQVEAQKAVEAADAVVWVIEDGAESLQERHLIAVSQVISHTQNNDCVLFFVVLQTSSQHFTVSRVVDDLRLWQMRNRVWFCTGTSLNGDDGLYEGLNWLTKKLEERVSF